MFNIVLVEPEIPQNTGNIARTCAVTGCALRLIKPLGFSLEDKLLKRAGLDYWDKLDIHFYDNFEAFESVEYFDSIGHANIPQSPKLILFTTHAHKNYADIDYNPGDYMVFGKETAGLGPKILDKYPQHCVRIPMRGDIRSLNLSNSVAIAVYEGLRQNNFKNMD